MNLQEYQDFVKSRKNYLGASDAPVIMGVSPWSTPYQLWQDKLDLGPVKDDNYAMKRGRDLEPIARSAYMAVTGNLVEPKQLFHPNIPYMMANFDGVSEDLTVAVEIKCPGKEDHDLAKDGMVPVKYFPQLQHQLAVIGINKVDYFSYRDDDVALVTVERDDEYIEKLYRVAEKFWDCVESLTAPPLVEKDYVEHSDEAWIEASSEWSHINEEMNMLKDKEKLLREILINHAAGSNSRGNGVKVQKVVRKGTIDMEELSKQTDVEKFRKPHVTSWRISR
ncbi:MAG: hypothetical protein K1000chlam2_00046 [Chlamydiae bacterium]|nr:hypothetical protein [Chlamydiota bacterium]